MICDACLARSAGGTAVAAGRGEYDRVEGRRNIVERYGGETIGWGRSEERRCEFGGGWERAVEEHGQLGNADLAREDVLSM